MKITMLGHTAPAIVFLLFFVFILIVIILFVVVKVVIYINRENADLMLGKFFATVLKELPNDDLDSIIIHGKLLKTYRHRQKDFWRIIKEIIEFSETNFSSDGKKILNRATDQFLDEIDQDFKPLHAFSIKDAMNMHTYEIFRHYFLFSQENNPQMRKKYISIVFSVILNIPFFMFLYNPNTLPVILNILSVIASIYIYQKLEKSLSPFSLVNVSLHWMGSMLIVAFSPHFIFRRALKNWFWWPIVSLFFFAMVGLWIAQKLWTRTDYEQRNVNTFIAHNKILFVFEIKFMPKIRYMILWFICIFTIFCVILMYATMYNKLFNNSFLYCIFLSMSTYLGTGYFSLDSIGLDSVESIYLLSEATASFLLNTFYIAYIANLMFSKKSK